MCYCAVKFIVMSWRCAVEKEECGLEHRELPTWHWAVGSVKKEWKSRFVVPGCRQLHPVTSSLNWLKVCSDSLQCPADVEKTQGEALSRWRGGVCVAPGVLQELSGGTLAAQTALCLLCLLGWAVGWFRDICFTLLSDKASGSDCGGAFLERQLCSLALRLKWVKQ